MTEEEFAQLSAGAALGALSSAELRAYRAALAAHPEWEARAQEDAATAASLAELVDDVTPPPTLRGDILARIATTPQGDEAPQDTPHAPPAVHPRRRWGGRAWFALAASFLVLVGIGAGTVIAVQHANRPAAVVALTDIEAAPDAQQASTQVAGGGSATLHWSPSLDKAVLVTEEMPKLTDDQTFELWYVRGKTAVAAGTFEATGSSTSALLDAGVKPGDIVAVTVEPSGGSPTGQPTSDPILTIPTA